MKNKQNIILIAVLMVIVSVFSVSNYIKKQKVYVLSSSVNHSIIQGNKDNNKLGQVDDIFEKPNGSNTMGKIIVHLEGEVAKPGVYELGEDSRVFDVVELAGGLTKNADLKRTNLAKKIVDEEYIYIPNKNEIDTGSSQYRDNLSTPSSAIENTNLININRANIIELKELPGIGDVLAGKIIEYRESNGGFKSVDDLKNVNGIGDKRFGDIKDKVTVK